MALSLVALTSILDASLFLVLSDAFSFFFSCLIYVILNLKCGVHCSVSDSCQYFIYSFCSFIYIKSELISKCSLGRSWRCPDPCKFRAVAFVRVILLSDMLISFLFRVDDSHANDSTATWWVTLILGFSYTYFFFFTQNLSNVLKTLSISSISVFPRHFTECFFSMATTFCFPSEILQVPRADSLFFFPSACLFLREFMIRRTETSIVELFPWLAMFWYVMFCHIPDLFPADVKAGMKS